MSAQAFFSSSLSVYLSSLSIARWYKPCTLAQCSSSLQSSGKLRAARRQGKSFFVEPEHLKYLFAEGRDLLFCFSRSQIFRPQIFVNAKESACSNPTMGCWFTEP